MSKLLNFSKADTEPLYSPSTFGHLKPISGLFHAIHPHHLHDKSHHSFNKILPYLKEQENHEQIPLELRITFYSLRSIQFHTIFHMFLLPLQVLSDFKH